MKKLSLILVLMLVGLVGCNRGNGETSNIVSDDRPEVNLDNFTVIEEESMRARDYPEAISLEEATLLGAQYILDVFEDNLEGRYMFISLRDYYPNLREGFGGVEWCGDIRASDYRLDDLLLSFCIDAFTGERTRIINSFDQIDSFWPPIEDLVRMSEDERLEIFPEPTTEELSLMLETASDFAQRHFGGDMQAIVVAEGFLDPYIPAGALTFYARNSDDFIIELSIQRETFELIGIFSFRPSDEEWREIPSF